MIGKGLKLNGDSLADVIMNRKTAEEGEAVHKEISERIISEYYPVLTAWFAKQDIPKLAEACATIEELEKVTYSLIPDTFYRDLCALLNKEKAIDDQQRFYLLIHLAERITFSAKQYSNQVMHQRAQRIASQKPKILL